MGKKKKAKKSNSMKPDAKFYNTDVNHVFCVTKKGLLQDTLDLLAMYLWNYLEMNVPPNSPQEIKGILERFLYKSPLQLQIYYEMEYEDFAKEYASVYSEVNKPKKEVKDESK